MTVCLGGGTGRERNLRIDGELTPNLRILLVGILSDVYVSVYIELLILQTFETILVIF